VTRSYQNAARRPRGLRQRDRPLSAGWCIHRLWGAFARSCDRFLRLAL